MPNIRRPNSAKTYHSFQNVYKGSTKTPMYELKAATPAATAALPQVGGNVMEYTSFPEADTYVCGGTLLKIGAVWGVLKEDTKATEDGAYATNGVFLVLATGATVTQGAAAYITTATGVCSDSPTSADLVGYFMESALQTDPDGLEAGDYALVRFNQPGA